MSLPLWPRYRHPLATAHGLWGGDLAHPRGSAHVGHPGGLADTPGAQTALRVPPAVSPSLSCGSAGHRVKGHILAPQL